MINIFITKKGDVPRTLSFSSTSKRGREMSANNFQQIMKFCTEVSDNGICISGGDPLLHTNIREILACINDNHHLRSICFNTNGLQLLSFVKEFNDLSKKKDFVNICLYYRENSLSQNLIETIKSLQKHNVKIEMGVEVLNTSNQNFNSILRFTEKVGIDTLRWEITIPKEKVIPSDFYYSVKNNLVCLIRLCAEKKITPYTTCNHIPYCLFSSDELRLLSYISNDNFGGKQCNNYVCFYPDNSVSGCTGNPENENYLFSNYINFMDIKESINSSKQLLQKKDIIVDCNDCRFKTLISEKCGCFFE